MSKKDALIQCVYAGPEMMDKRFKMHEPPVDGDSMEANSIFCPNCGNRQPRDANYCAYCGTPLRPDNRSEPPMGYRVYAGPPIPDLKPKNSFTGMNFTQLPYPQNYQVNDEDPGDVYAGPPIDDEPCDE